MPVLVGKFLNNSENASRPPAEAPTPTTAVIFFSFDLDGSEPSLEVAWFGFLFIARRYKRLAQSNYLADRTQNVVPRRSFWFGFHRLSGSPHRDRGLIINLLLLRGNAVHREGQADERSQTPLPEAQTNDSVAPWSGKSDARWRSRLLGHVWEF